MAEDRSEAGNRFAERTSGLARHAQRLSDDSLARIRAAANAIFERDGYSGVTMAGLADEAGVTRQTLYRHFASKYEVACDFMQGFDAETLAVWGSLRACDLADPDSVRGWVRRVIAHQVERRHVRAYVELTSTEPRYRRVLANLIGTIVAALSDVHPVFAEAAAQPEGLAAAKAHLFVATLMERSDFIALGEEWFARAHLEAIMTEWLLALSAQRPAS